MESRGIFADISGSLAGLMASQMPAAIRTSATIAMASATNVERCFRLGRLRLRRFADFERIDPHRLGDVLEVVLAEIVDREIEPRLDLAVSVLGKIDRAGFGDALQSCGDIDPVAHQIAVALLDDVAEMDADAKLDASLGRQPGVALDHAVLHLGGAAHGIDHAPELDEDAVAGLLHHPAVIGLNRGIDQIAA